MFRAMLTRIDSSACRVIRSHCGAERSQRSVALLLFYRKEYGMFKHILLPTDGSKLSNKAVKQAINLASQSNGVRSCLLPDTGIDIVNDNDDRSCLLDIWGRRWCDSMPCALPTA
jgi:hypothetical protein